MRGYLLIIATLVIVISVLITIGVFFQGSLQMEMAEQFSKQQLLLSKSIADHIGAHFSFIKEGVLHVSEVLSKRDIKNRDALDDLIKNVLEKKKTLKADFAIIGVKGDVIFSEEDAQALKPDIPEILDRAKRIAPESISAVETLSKVYIISPLYTQNNFRGVVFLSTRIEEIAGYFVSNIKLGSKGYAWMMSKTGTLLYHPTQPGMIGGNIYKTDAACFKCHLNFDLEKKIIEGETINYGRYIAPTGEDKIIAFSTANIDSMTWIVAVSAPYSEVTYAIKRSMRLYSYLIISIFAATAVVSTLLIVFNRKRIKAEETAKRKEELEKYAALLEKKVNERTAELTSEKEKVAHSEKLASLGRLSAGIAHEIGNPLTSIFSFVQILKESEEDEFKKESLNTIYFHVNRISGILKQLSGFTKMPTGEMKECIVNEIIENSVNIIHFDKKAKEISFIEDLSPLCNTACVCEDKQLSQVFVNLALNAIDAMPDGGTLTVRSILRDGDIVIQFEDTGIGITKEELPKLFDPFYTTKEKGTGLGLAVSYNIIKKMNGTITVESEIGKGSIFTIKIPYIKNKAFSLNSDV